MALPLQHRLLLLIMWQSGIEIGRVLGLHWQDVEGIERGEQPLRLDFVGRKRHRRPYYIFVGQESVEHLKLWREKWVDFMKRSPGSGDLIFVGKKQAPISYLWLAQRFWETAVRLANQGLEERRP